MCAMLNIIGKLLSALAKLILLTVQQVVIDLIKHIPMLYFIYLIKEKTVLYATVQHTLIKFIEKCSLSLAKLIYLLLRVLLYI